MTRTRWFIGIALPFVAAFLTLCTAMLFAPHAADIMEPLTGWPKGALQGWFFGLALLFNIMVSVGGAIIMIGMAVEKVDWNPKPKEPTKKEIKDFKLFAGVIDKLNKELYAHIKEENKLLDRASREYSKLDAKFGRIMTEFAKKKMAEPLPPIYVGDAKAIKKLVLAQEKLTEDVSVVSATTEYLDKRINAIDDGMDR